MTGLEGSRRVEGRVSEDTRAREAANRRRRGLVRHHSALGTRGEGVTGGLTSTYIIKPTSQDPFHSLPLRPPSLLRIWWQAVLRSHLMTAVLSTSYLPSELILFIIIFFLIIISIIFFCLTLTYG